MDKGMKLGLTVQATKGCTMMARNMAVVNSHGLMARPMMASFTITTLKATASITGKMAVFTKETGRITRWKAKASLTGLMVASMKAITLTIRKRVMECLCGQMVASTMDSGVTASKMALATTRQSMASLEPANGKKANVLLGCQND